MCSYHELYVCAFFVPMMCPLQLTISSLTNTISSAYRNLRETDKESITLPANLTNTQRKFVHELSKQMGLKSKSHGKGEQRRITVSKVTSSSGGLMMMGGSSNPNNQTKDKKKDENSLPTLKEYKQVPRINIGKRGEEALVQHLLKFPPNDKELAESKETGSSLLLKRKANEDGATANGDNTVDDDEGGDVIVANNQSGEQHLLSLNDILPPPQQITDTAKTTSSHSQQQQKLQAKQSRIINQRIQSHHTLQQQTKQHVDYKKMMKQRQNLPAYNYATDICNVLKNKKNQVVILTGDTGCGYVRVDCICMFI